MERAYAPHCDSSILHKPGECKYCDEYADWQEMRTTQRINFTGHFDKDKAPCPSHYFRDPEIAELWGGNMPTSMVDEAQREVMLKTYNILTARGLAVPPDLRKEIEG